MGCRHGTSGIVLLVLHTGFPDVGVEIDHSRKDIFAVGVDDPTGLCSRTMTDIGDLLSNDPDIGLLKVISNMHHSVAD